MAKRKATAKKIKSTATGGKKRVTPVYTIEHDFIIIAGGGLVVLMIVALFFFL